MSDPFTETIKVECRAFGKSRMRTVEATPEAKESPLPYYEHPNLLFISRPEEMYASPHYKGRNAVRITSEDWRK